MRVPRRRLDGDVLVQHALDVRDQRRVLQIVSEGPDRTPDVLREDLEGLRDARGEFPDAQLPVQENRRDVGPIEQVLDVVVQLLQFRVLFLILRVDGVQLLVDGVELLVRALELLVRGNQLLVRRLKLFVRRLELFDRRLKTLFRVRQFVLERVLVIVRERLQVDGPALGLGTVMRPARPLRAPAAPPGSASSPASVISTWLNRPCGFRIGSALTVRRELCAAIGTSA